ncbi:MAG: hypothetical protein HY721_34765, partial [Planctomycetes bacterium]|nr:hypothetical protein [Planctomycetota bacterium]
MTERVRQILQWLKRFARSGLSGRAFFRKHRPPFSLTRFLHYLKLFEATGAHGLADGRARGNNRRIHSEAEGFLAGFAAAHAEATEQDLRAEIRRRFGIEVSQPAISRCLKRLGVSRERRKRPAATVSRVAAYGGFELVVALAWHFGWPQWTARAIQEAIRAAKRSTRFARERHPDLKGRTRRGCFTARYNRRPDVRRERFQSVALKRPSRSLKTMNIANVRAETLARKCLAVLSLPLVSHNGEVRTVNTAPGSALKDLCGFDYRQPTLARFLAELKYLGISTDLLRQQVGFWAGVWRDVMPERND